MSVENFSTSQGEQRSACRRDRLVAEDTCQPDSTTIVPASAAADGDMGTGRTAVTGAG